MMKKNNWIELNREVWKLADSNTSIRETVRLIELQLYEINEHIYKHHNKKRILNELCDVISISARAIERMGFDLDKAMLFRIQKRYQGKVDEILRKYQKLIK
jgi:hypothetical protein